MVHALREAHRVLKADGILIDLRPAPAHRRVGLGEGARWQFVASLHEDLADDHAANRAVSRILREGLFRRERLLEFDLDRVMDTTEDFRAWLDEFVQRRELQPQEWLLKRVERVQPKPGHRRKITARGPLRLAVLRKLESE